MIIKDGSRNLLECELPKGYETQGHMEVISYPLTQRIHIEVKATKGNCMIHYQTGESYIYEKKRFQMPYMFEQPQNSKPQNDTGAWYATPQSLTDDIDSIAASILGKKVKGKDYCDLSENMSRRIEEEYRNSIQEFISNIQFAMSLSAVPLGICIRKYLLDGGIGVYEDKDRILAVCINRQGFEIDTINAAGIYENISDRPFGQAETDMNTPIASAEWKIPFVGYMISDKKEDLKDFLRFIDTVRSTDETERYIKEFNAMQEQAQKQKASMESMQNQAMWNAAFAQQQASWAASDRLRDSLSRDLDSWRAGLNQSIAQNDMRFNTGHSLGESSDDYIQRLRHESIMGVETYERNDGSTVEYSNYADRVFENNLDSTQHFGTHHYFDDYVPEGWHEMKKK